MNPPKQFPPLTQEEITQIEQSNNLLKVFSAWFEGLEKLPELEGIDLNPSMLFFAFFTGANAVRKQQQFATMKVSQEIQELHRLVQTMSQAPAENPNETA